MGRNSAGRFRRGGVGAKRAPCGRPPSFWQASLSKAWSSKRYCGCEGRERGGQPAGVGMVGRGAAMQHGQAPQDEQSEYLRWGAISEQSGPRHRVHTCRWNGGEMDCTRASQTEGEAALPAWPTSVVHCYSPARWRWTEQAWSMDKRHATHVSASAKAKPNQTHTNANRNKHGQRNDAAGSPLV